VNSESRMLVHQCRLGQKEIHIKCLVHSEKSISLQGIPQLSVITANLLKASTNLSFETLQTVDWDLE
jgi:hypothetical protein